MQTAGQHQVATNANDSSLRTQQQQASATGATAGSMPPPITTGKPGTPLASPRASSGATPPASPRAPRASQGGSLASAQLRHSSGGGLHPDDASIAGMSLAGMSVQGLTDSDDDSDHADGEDGDNGGYGKAKIKRTLTRLQRQQRHQMAVAAMLQQQGGMPFASPPCTPRPSAGGVTGPVMPPDAAAAADHFDAATGASEAAGPPGDGSSGGGAKSSPSKQQQQGAVPAQADPAAADGPSANGAAVGAVDQPGLKAPVNKHEDELLLLRDLMGRSVQGPTLWKRMPWFDQTEVRMYTAGFIITLIMSPLVLLIGFAANVNDVKRPEAYRLLFFFAAWPVVWFVVNCIVWQLVIITERILFKQALCYHSSLRRATTWLVCCCLLLIWFNVAAMITPCPDKPCRQRLLHHTNKAADAVWKMLVCATLFSLTHFITAIVKRLLNRHVYKAAHYYKVEHVLWKQFWLVMLAQPRPSDNSDQDQLMTADARTGDRADQGTTLRQRKGRFGWSHDKPDQQQQYLPTHAASGRALAMATTYSGPEGAELTVTNTKAASEPQVSTTSSEQHPAEGRHGKWGALPTVAEGSESRVLRSSSISFGHHLDMQPSFKDDAALSRDQKPSRISQLRARLRSGWDHPAQPQPAPAAPQCTVTIKDPQTATPVDIICSSGPAAEAVSRQGASRVKCQQASRGGLFGCFARSQRRDGFPLPAGEVPDDPLLDQGVLKALNVTLDGKPLDATRFSQKEWKRVREGIAIQTYDVLMKRYNCVSLQEEEEQLKAAKRLGKALFYHVKKEAERYITRDDFDPFFANLSNAQAEADKAFFYLDKENNAIIGMHEMVNRVVEAVRERQNMAASLRDINTIVKTLTVGTGLALNILFMPLYLAVWHVDVAKGFSTIAAALLFFSFMFSNTAKNVFEATLFLLVAHAYDVGDLLQLEGETYRVGKITLLYTTLVKRSGEVTLYPNARMMGLPLVNLSKGNCLQGDQVVIVVDAGHSGEAIYHALTRAMQQHFEENERHFNSVPVVRFTGIVNPFKVELNVSWTYNFGPTDALRAKKVKSAVLQVIQEVLGDLPAMIVEEPNPKGSTAALDAADPGAANETSTMDALAMGATAGACLGMAIM